MAENLEEATTVDEVDELIQQKIQEAREKEEPEFPTFGDLSPYIIKSLELQGISVSAPLPGVAGIPPALQSFAEAMIGEEVIKALYENLKAEEAAELIAKQVTDMIAKIMHLLMIGVTLATAGLVPAPPDLRLVKEYFKLLEDFAKGQTQDQNTGGNSNSSSPSGAFGRSRGTKSTGSGDTVV